MIPRKEAEAHVHRFMHALRMAARQSAQSLAPRIAKADSATLCEAMRTQLWDNMLSSFAVLAGQLCKARLPAWWIDAALGDLGDCFREPGVAVDERRKAIEAAFEYCVALNAEQRGDAAAGPPECRNADALSRLHENPPGEANAKAETTPQ
jgi:hypothetical protein